jgi:hypothetical protein
MRQDCDQLAPTDSQDSETEFHPSARCHVIDAALKSEKWPPTVFSLSLTLLGAAQGAHGEAWVRDAMRMSVRLPRVP